MSRLIRIYSAFALLSLIFQHNAAYSARFSKCCRRKFVVCFVGALWVNFAFRHLIQVHSDRGDDHPQHRFFMKIRQKLSFNYHQISSNSHHISSSAAHSTLLWSGSGDHTGQWIVSTSRHLYLRFTSDYSVQYTGFNIKYVSAVGDLYGK